LSLVHIMGIGHRLLMCRPKDSANALTVPDGLQLKTALVLAVR